MKYRIKNIKINVNKVIPKYKHNQVYVKQYGNGVIKVIVLKSVRNKEYKEEEPTYRTKKGSKHENKIGCNIRRAKARVQELVICNEWDWFVTLTLDAKKHNRQDLTRWYKELTQWIRNYNRKFNIKIKYLIVPELHGDGVSWHMHGLIMGLSEEHLTQLQRGNKMSKSQLERIVKGEKVYVLEAYERKFGFCSIEPIHNKIAIGKYISKSMDLSAKNGVTKVNAHTYYCSKGLKGAETIKVGTLTKEMWREKDYGNEFCKVFLEPYSEKVLHQLVGSIDDNNTDLIQGKKEKIIEYISSLNQGKLRIKGVDVGSIMEKHYYNKVYYVYMKESRLDEYEGETTISYAFDGHYKLWVIWECLTYIRISPNPQGTLLNILEIE